MNGKYIKAYKYLNELTKNDKYIDENKKVLQNAIPMLVDIFSVNMNEAKNIINEFNTERNLIMRYI